ncbi:DMT family transporter [Streptomyces griseoaurantiacus]|uniref:DMT family transporter n=1 Tax=Streptomyces griseoaurantiacus TaxID=68213 RepID=A0A7W2DYN5_9ACTN|nr:DMT family transporter [Streptomyces griseoaurantiacus]MBA5225465.1 DMT family transporter [Streptomyces griseoaurantiacus]
MGLVLSVVFALCAAFSNALATVLQRRAALSVPESRGFRLGLVVDLLHRPVWVAGMLAVVVAGVGQAAALATGPLSLVQPLFVLELPLALLLASLAARTRLPGALWLAVAAVVAGLGVALAAAAPSGQRQHVSPDRWIPALVACAGLALLLVAAGFRRPHGKGRAGCLGAATAVCYALTAGLMKSAVAILDSDGLVAFLTVWQTYAFAAAGVCAVLLLEHAMQGGPLVASQPALTLGDATVSLLLGVVLYQEHVRTGWWLLPQLLGVGLIVGGVLVLARRGTDLRHEAPRAPEREAPAA